MSFLFLLCAKIFLIHKKSLDRTLDHDRIQIIRFNMTLMLFCTLRENERNGI
jgi:hypothetical protein